MQHCPLSPAASGVHVVFIRRYLRWPLITAIIVFVLMEITNNYDFDSFGLKEHLRTTNCVQHRPHQHVYYLKIHKTGSTTMYSILAEFSRSHDLLPLLPSGNHINLSPPLKRNQLLLANGIQKYDMVFNHHIFSPDIVLNYMHNDTFKFTTLREPFKQFVSSFNYFKNFGMGYLKKIPGQDPMKTFFEHRDIYEAKGYTSYTNNRQSIDLGFDMRHSLNDTDYIKEFIKLTDQRFNIILITDYFHESLVILRRSLNWSTQDILYVTKNARQKTPNTERNRTKETTYRQLHSVFSKADIMLYDFFLTRFKARMAMEKGLREEVSEFENVLQKVKEYCDSVTTTQNPLNLPRKKWTDPIYLLPHKCKWLKLMEIPFTRFLQHRQKAVLTVY